MPEDETRQGGPRRGPAEGNEFLPPLEFSSIVYLLYFPVLIQLGLVNEPGSDAPTLNLPLAKRNIDLLDILKDKTKGNLEEEEQKFLEGVIGQLKMVYLQKADLVKM
jgi:hypothetical protein